MTTTCARDAREDSARDDGEATRGRPRLAIEKMVLENFKSYAGAQHVGPFLGAVRRVRRAILKITITAASDERPAETDGDARARR